MRAPATIRQGYIGGQTSARVTGGDLCLRYAVRQGDRSQRGTIERERDGASVGDEGRDRRRERDGEKQVDISVLPAHWDPFYANERTNERPTERMDGWWGGERGVGSGERRED